MRSVHRVVHVGDLDRIRAAGLCWRPIRRALGITGFGINAYSADRGGQLIEEHDETSGGSAAHEELYLVIAGHARFTVDGDEIDAPNGTLVFVPEARSRRSATALADQTVTVVVGGVPGTITASAWEYAFAAEPAAEAGDHARAYDIVAEGLADHPEHPSLHYNLACYASLAGETDRALAHLAHAFAQSPETREWAATDADLDPLRSDPRFANLERAVSARRSAAKARGTDREFRPVIRETGTEE